MTTKQYKKIYSISKTGGSPIIQVHLARETKKTYIDITSRVIRSHKEKGTFPWLGYGSYLGRLLKDKEYTLIFNDYWLFMYGSDLNKLKEAWFEAVNPVDREDLEPDSNSVDVMVIKLNNQEETETGEWEDGY